MSILYVTPQKQAALKQKMDELQILESDLEEQFIRSGGKGGQNVNKVATCVRLKHIPSGLDIKCQKSRYQLLNRYYARCLLVKKIETIIKGKQSAENQRIEKIKRQKRKRSKRAKEKILTEKRIQSQKKTERKGIKNIE
jgi:protein subunit release factor B